MEYTEKQLDIFKRLGNQLAITMNTIKSHSAVADKLNILQTVLNNFRLQTEWKTGGRFARLLMAASFALEGHEVGTSAAAFAGPCWMKWQKGAFGLMLATLNITERRQASLLMTFNELMSLGAAYFSIQSLGNRTNLFPKSDPPAAKSAGFLFRELGVTFLLYSGIIEAAYGQMASTLGFNEKSQKLISEIGLFFILMTLILIDAEDNPKNEELIEAFTPLLAKSIGSVEQAVQMAQEKGIADQEVGMTASSQVQLMNHAINSGSAETIKEAIENSFQAFEVPYNMMKGDIALINKFNRDLYESFNSIYYQSQQSVTTMQQA